jgi:branched-chain amino acid transport system permease protein
MPSLILSIREEVEDLLYWLQILINGLLLGGVYGLIGVGFSLVWGVLNIINISHGMYVMLGAFITFSLFHLWRLDPLLTIPISMLVVFTLAFWTQRYVINRIMKAPPFMVIILTYGMALLLENLSVLIWSADVKRVSPSYAMSIIKIGPLIIPWARLVTFVVALGITFLIHQIVMYTRLGRSIRAVRLDPETAGVMGIDVKRTYALTFAISSALAAIAGTLVSISYPISPNLHFSYLMQAFIVCALGGLGNVQGALWGGLLFGALQTVATSLLGSTYQGVVSYGILLLILVIRPQGLAGREFY